MKHGKKVWRIRESLDGTTFSSVVQFFVLVAAIFFLVVAIIFMDLVQVSRFYNTIKRPWFYSLHIFKLDYNVLASLLRIENLKPACYLL